MPSNHQFRYNSDSSSLPDNFQLAHFKTNGNNGPEGLRSLGSPVMSRLLYQAELRALSKGIFSQI